MTKRRITRDKRLTANEAEKYRKVREQIEQELPELVSRHHDRVAAKEELARRRDELKVDGGSKFDFG